jgi:hypothetical protein
MSRVQAAVDSTAPADVNSGMAADRYEDFLAAVRDRFAAAAKPPLFVTAPQNLFEVFLAALPAELRAENTCATCRHFFERFGGLVTIDERGKTSAVLWSESRTPEPYASAVHALAEAIASAPVVGVFVSDDREWGTATKGGWTHLAVTPTQAQVYSSATRTAEQAAAEKLEDFRNLVAGLEHYPRSVVKQAASLLQTGKLYRSEKCVAVAKWLLEVHKARKSAKSDRARENLTWRFVASAPPGFCHVRSTIIGALLDDLANGLRFELVKARFDAKMDPLQYQRPTAAPGQQNIERAETIVKQLRTAGSLARRFAKLADIEALWRPHSAAGERGGVFAQVKPKRKVRATTRIDAPAVVMTWEKFARTVLPDAAEIHYQVPKTPKSYAGLVTALHPEAPPIIQWDSENQRNPVTWYMYVNGSPPEHWNLRADSHHPVTAITLSPAMWGGTERHGHHGKMVLFVLDGARDLQYKKGAGFFPEFLKPEYREIRATIEAYAKAAVVEGQDEAEACGIALHQGQAWGYCFRVTGKDGITVDYQLDRWD